MLLGKSGLLALSPALAGSPAFAHHGWRRNSQDDIELTGVITGTDFGGPRPRVEVSAGGRHWQVHLCQSLTGSTGPQGGLTDGLLQPGSEITLTGSGDHRARSLRAHRVTLDGVVYSPDPASA